MNAMPLHAGLTADFLATRFAGVPVVAAENKTLLENVRRITAWLRQLGVCRSSLVITLFPPDKTWIALDIAILRCGAIHIPFHIPEKVPLATEYFEKYFLLVHPNIKFEPGTKGNQMITADLSDDCLKKFSAEMSNENEAASVCPSDPAEIIFSYNNDSVIKPFAISHENLVKTAVAAGKELPLISGDKYLSLLPFSKIYGRVSLLTHQLLGCSIDCSQQMLLPSRLIKVSKAASVAVVPSMLQYPVKVDGACTEQLKGRALATLDELPSEAIRQVFGDALKIIICGGSMISPDLLKKFETGSLQLVEGYGLTQTTGVFTLNTTIGHGTGSKGIPLDHMELMISAESEILAKGPGISPGTVLPDGAIENICDSDGWLHTGDEGYLDANGFLFINGNKKRIFKLANGYYYDPLPDEKLISENISAPSMISRDAKGNLHLLTEKQELSDSDKLFLRNYKTRNFSYALSSVSFVSSIPLKRHYLFSPPENALFLQRSHM